MSSLEENVAEWVKFDNEQQRLSLRLKELREQKSSLQDTISDQFSSRGLVNPIVKISDGKLAMVERKVTQSLTLSLVEEALTGCIADSGTVKQLMDHIKHARQVTHQVELRRYYSKRA